MALCNWASSAGCSEHQKPLAHPEDMHFQPFEESKEKVRRQRNTQQ
jgi:hypothetical protein